LSNHLYRSHSGSTAVETQRQDNWYAAVIVVILLTVGLPVYYVAQVRDSKWPSTRAQLLGTRIQVVNVIDSPYRSDNLLYEVEAHVAYDLKGQHYDQWLPASESSRDQAYLALIVSRSQPNVCTVHWNPRNPSNIRAVLEPLRTDR
jgi:hypothetical protein